MITDRFRAAFRFFLANCGYSTPPGRVVCAAQLARAEREARELSEWEAFLDVIGRPSASVGSLGGR